MFKVQILIIATLHLKILTMDSFKYFWLWSIFNTVRSKSDLSQMCLKIDIVSLLDLLYLSRLINLIYTCTVSQEQLFLFKSWLRAQKLTDLQKKFTGWSLMLWILFLSYEKLWIWKISYGSTAFDLYYKVGNSSY